MKKRKVTIYKNGATVRLHNRKMSFTENEGSFDVVMKRATGEPDGDIVLGKTKRGVTTVCFNLTEEAMLFLGEAIGRYFLSKRTNQVGHIGAAAASSLATELLMQKHDKKVAVAGSYVSTDLPERNVQEAIIKIADTMPAASDNTYIIEARPEMPTFLRNPDNYIAGKKLPRKKRKK